MTNDPQRPNPDQLLADIELEERRKQRGKLKVFLGYAGGVGKSFQMLDEGRRRRERSEDVVVCALQPEYPPEVQEVLKKLEIIPVLKSGGGEAIDMPAVLHRHPQVALIDGMAYDNPPGSPNAHRWQDVEQLLDAGISVITSVNLQYLEKVQDEVQRITGKRPSTTIPRGFLDRSADEIVVVDAPATQWLGRGAAAERGTPSLAEQHQLSRLREMALLVAAGVVDRQLESYLRSHGMDQSWGVQERILVCIPPHTDAARMIESGRRNADRFQGDFYVIYVEQRDGSKEHKAILQKNLDYARQLGAELEIVSGLDPAEAIVNFAWQKGVTQIFVGHSTAETSWKFWKHPVDRLIRSAEGIDVVVYPL